MACKEAKAFGKHIVLLLVMKWERPYSRMVGYACGKIGMAIIWSNTMMLCGARYNKRYVPDLEDMVAYEAVQERNLDR